MNDYALGFTHGVLVVTAAILIKILIDLGVQYWRYHSTLSVNNWRFNRQNRYAADGKGDEDKWIRSRSWREK